MARPHRAPKVLCFWRRYRSRWWPGRSIRQPSQAPILVNIYGASCRRGPRSDPPMRITPTGAPAPQCGEIRNPHRSARVARGFPLWRISYACRHPISFTEADVHGPLSPSRKRLLVQVLLDGRNWAGCGTTAYQFRNLKAVTRSVTFRGAYLLFDTACEPKFLATLLGEPSGWNGL